VTTCTRCGATLAESAQYCMQCGTPAGGVPADAAPLAAGTFVGPALLSGTLVGILGSIPFVNCLCCVWMLGGGGLAAWLVGRSSPGGPRTLTYGDGAFAGVLSGAWAALVATVAFILPRVLLPDFFRNQQDEIEALLSEFPEVAEEARELLMLLAADPPSMLAVLVTLVPNLLLYGLFSMIGGILLVAVLRRPSGRTSPAAGSSDSL
jgi:hypothetical protein